MPQQEYETALYDRLRDVAQHVRNNASELARRVYHHRLQVEVDVGEYFVISESASFLAFVGLGGDVDQPEAFDWEGRRKELITQATAQVRRDLQEKGSDAHDIFYRNNPRKEGVYMWDSWSTTDSLDRVSREHAAEALRGLLPVLQERLKSRDVQILVWRFVEGKTQAEIGQLLGGNNGVGAMGVLRARRRAAEALGPRWRMLVCDAVHAA